MGAPGKDLELAKPDCRERLTHASPLLPCSAHRTVGWGGRIRTFEYGIQSPAPYRLATPHRSHGSTRPSLLRPASRRLLAPNLARIWHLSAELEEANLRTGRITRRERQVYPMASFGGKSLDR